MLLVFLDECSDSKFKDYFGLSLAIMNMTFYSQLKREVQCRLIDGGWDPNIEFKGEFLFSASKGCTDVDVARRVELASQLIELHVAKINRRVRFYYAQMKSTAHKSDYLTYAPRLLEKALPKRTTRKSGKDLVSIVCDQRSDIDTVELQKALETIVIDKGYVLHEQVISAVSNFHTVGLMYADLVGYLTARIDTISNDAELLGNVPQEFFESNGKLRKLRTSTALMSQVRKLQRFRVDTVAENRV